MIHRKAFAGVVSGACLAAIVLFSTAGPSTAVAGDPGGTNAGKSNQVLAGPWAVQARLIDATDRIRGAMEQRDRSYTGIVIDPDNNVLTLYVHGTPNPASLKALGAEQGRGYRLVVSQAPNSRAELDAAQDKLWRDRDRLNIETVVAKEDGTSLVAGVRAPNAAARVGSPTQSPDQNMTAVAGVPVVTEPREIAATWGTRLDDSNPFNGGARIANTSLNNKECTSSFGVAIGSTTYMVTAGHCGSNGNDFMSNSWQPLGKMTWNGEKQGKLVDAALIKAPAEGYIYDGAYNDGNGYRKPVAGYSRTSVGMYVCTSGSFSGVVCNIKVTYLGQRGKLDDGYTVVSDVAEQQSHTAAAGSGDSGGPVFTVTANDNFARMTVVGTVSSGDKTTTVSCPGVPSSPSRTCHWRMQFARFDNLRIQAGITKVLTKTS